MFLREFYLAMRWYSPAGDCEKGINRIMSEFRCGYCPGVIGKNVRYRWSQIIGTFVVRKGIQKMYNTSFTAISLNYPKLIKLETHHTMEISEMNL